MTVGPRRIAAALLLAGFPDDDEILATMVGIHGGETSGNVWAVGGPNKNGSYDYGAFQINVPLGHQLPAGWDNYILNARMALPLYKLQGYAAWYGRKNLDKKAGFAVRPDMTWRQWGVAGVVAMRRRLTSGQQLSAVASLYDPLEGC